MKKWVRAALILTTAAAMSAGCGTQPAQEQGSGGGERQTSFDKAPEMQIDEAKSYEAVVKTSKGEFTIELFAKDAPVTVNSFVFLSRQKYYEGIVFHRIVPDYIIQTGDPTGTGRGGPGYSFEDELGGPHEYGPGIVAMANAGANTNGSQFFICTGEWSKKLNEIPNYTIFGRIKDGMDTVLAIGATPVGGMNNDTPQEKITIESITIHES
ncbi:peptidylprolyl isomerase [Paenibacillus antri]|uniref:Peptidyl-prolyl cis-trans isomerase n=1 Tax=Paenibacillus antri TaxID=2582848 RepID=A0A5R9GFQ8_9BACL|nr:peptidylprolyl isomerase [Paenibacillus antri]TLS53226.1 peptidylprolyl isomerase [Paenibacillus antri]